MARKNIKDPRAVVFFLLAIFCSSAVLTLFIIGGIFYSSEHPKTENYDHSICEVYASSYKTYQCKARYYRYNCYGPVWFVHYGVNETFAIVETDKRYRYYSDAIADTKYHQVGELMLSRKMMIDFCFFHQINQSYSCWYDRRNPSIAQWDEPSTRIAVILLCCGGLAVVLTVIFFVFTYILTKQQSRQSSFDNISFQAYPNTITKP